MKGHPFVFSLKFSCGYVLLDYRIMSRSNSRQHIKCISLYAKTSMCKVSCRGWFSFILKDLYIYPIKWKQSLLFWKDRSNKLSFYFRIQYKLRQFVSYYVLWLTSLALILYPKSFLANFSIPTACQPIFCRVHLAFASVAHVSLVLALFLCQSPLFYLHFWW